MDNFDYAPRAPERVVWDNPNLRLTDQPEGRATEIADWVLENIPWTVAVPDWPGFHDRWSLLTRNELAEVECELGRRAALLDAPEADLEAIAVKLTGRLTYWMAAADWLTLNPGASIADPEFFESFGQLTRAELILAALEHKRRILGTQ